MNLGEQLQHIELNALARFYTTIDNVTGVAFHEALDVDLDTLKKDVVVLADHKKRLELVNEIQEGYSGLGESVSIEYIEGKLRETIEQTKREYREKINEYASNPIINSAIEDGLSIREAHKKHGLFGRFNHSGELASYLRPAFGFGLSATGFGVTGLLIYSTQEMNRIKFVDDETSTLFSVGVGILGGVSSLLIAGTGLNYRNAQLDTIDRAISLSYKKP